MTVIELFTYTFEHGLFFVMKLLKLFKIFFSVKISKILNYLKEKTNLQKKFCKINFYGSVPQKKKKYFAEEIVVIDNIQLFSKCYGKSQAVVYLMKYVPKYMRSILKIHAYK